MTQSGSAERIAYFDAHGVALTEDIMPMDGVDESVLAGFAKLMEAGADAEGDAERVRCLFRQPGPQGLSLCRAWFKSGFILPRHSHDADCVYYITGGSINIGNRTLSAGEGFFIPKDVPYSYQAGPEGVEILEFRNAAQFNILFGNNDERHWNRMADAIRDHAPDWSEQTRPPLARKN